MPENETENFTVTTSDMPVAVEAEIEKPEPKEEPKPEETPAQHEEEQPRKKSRAQARIESLAAEKRELQRELDELRQQKKGTPAELNPDDFDDYDDYLEAVDKQKGKGAEEEEHPAAAYADPLADFRDELESKFDDTRDVYSDFDEKIKAMPVLTVDMLAAIAESDDAGEVAYYLARNPDAAEKMAKLSFGKMAIEIGKIETQLRKPAKEEAKQPPKPKPTQAPAPITPVGGGGEYQKPLEDLSFSEFEQTRNAEASSKKFW
jgi:predicted RNase H-like nuclease (RuvC/YqgF family)